MLNFFHSFHILRYLFKSKPSKTLPHLCEFDSIQMISKKVVACTAIKRNDVRKILMMGRKKRGTSCNIFSTFYNHQYTKKKAYECSVANSQYQMNSCKDFPLLFWVLCDVENDYSSKAQNQSTYSKEFELFIIL